MTRKLKSPARKGGRSGAVGGPATVAGINYQVAYAVLRALQVIPKVFASPHLEYQVRLEPRVGVAPGTAWDLAFDPGPHLVEAKLNPAKDDVLEWLHRSRAAFRGGASTQRYRLLSGVNEGRHLRQVKGLIRLAKESHGDLERFSQLRSYESEDYSDLLTELGAHPLELLDRLDVQVAPPETLCENIDTLSVTFAPQDPARFVNHLFTRISYGLQNRITIDLRNELEAYEREHAPLALSQYAEPEHLDVKAAAALFLLQCCPKPIPRDVLADVLDMRRDEVEIALKALIDAHVVASTSTHFSVAPLAHRITSNLGRERRGALLRALARFVNLLPALDRQSRDQVANVCHLATRTASDCKDEIAVAFMGIDKHLKQLGDKHTVLEMAKVSIAAARAARVRTEEVARAEAHALICGESWVYQRVGRLDEARRLAQDSLERGQAIGWSRNNAFCEKCIGRLCRMAAEATDDAKERKRLFEESAYRLQKAIELFTVESGFGPNSTEVGECYSLLGRTLLMMGEVVSANEKVIEAERLITVEDSKEGMDLAILRGELAAVADNPSEAERHYGSVLSNTSVDLVKTEMRARAHLQRARVRARQGKSREADEDYASAEEIWTNLQEQHAAATPSIERTLMRVKLLPERMTQIQSLRPEVTAIALRLHESKVAQLQEGSSRRARDAGDPYWDQLISEARRQWALDAIEW